MGLSLVHDLSCLATAPSLCRIDVPSSVRGAGLARLNEIRTLRVLVLEGKAYLGSLATCRSLQSMTVFGARRLPSSLFSIPTLTSLSAPKCRYVEAEGSEPWRCQLRVLETKDMALVSTAAPTLVELTCCVERTDDAFVPMAVWKARRDPHGLMEILPRLQRLERLDLRCDDSLAQRPRRFLRALMSCAQLRAVTLSLLCVIELDWFAQLPLLERLSLASHSIVGSLAGCTTLREFRWQSLQQLAFSSSSDDDDSDDDDDDDGERFARLQQRATFAAWKASRRRGYCDAAIASLATLPSLRTVALHCEHQITSVTALRRSRSITTIDCDFCFSLRDDGVVGLEEIPTLTALKLGSTGVTHAGRLCSAPALRELELPSPLPSIPELFHFVE